MPPKLYKRSNTKPQTPRTNENNIDIANYKKAKYLIIVESPSKCKKIEGFLGNEYKCIASKGHICSIKGLKSINSKNNFETEYSIIEEKAKHAENMRSIIELFPYYNILLASDDDREGEAISWHICRIFNLPIQTTPRIIFREITKSAIVKAIENPTTINMSLVYAQQARQILDVIVGFKISPFLSLYNM
jgi:DNA topoisomerase-1